MKVQYKIILAFLGLAGTILILSFFFVYKVSEWQRSSDFHSRLKNKAVTTVALLFQFMDHNADVLKKVDSTTQNTLYNESIAIYNASNQNIYHSEKKLFDTIPYDSSVISNAIKNKIYFFNYKGKEAVAVYYTGKKENAVAVIAASDKDGIKRLRQLLQILIITLASGLLLAVFAGWYFSRRLMFPLKKLITGVNTISASNIENRVPEGTINDEWQHLTSTFNHLLSRLQESFEIQGRFIANASHELSTPLTSVTNQIDVTLNQSRTAEVYKKTLESIRVDITHLNMLAKSLLELASTSRGGSVQADLIRIDEVLLQIPGLVKKIDPHNSVHIELDDLPEDEKECSIHGNGELLLGAFRNLAENGCKYSPDKNVVINLSFSPGKIFILFKNKGHIPDENIPYLFQPFYRGENSSHQKGYGMGLSLARRIILLHNGEIKAERLWENDVFFVVSLPSATLKIPC